MKRSVSGLMAGVLCVLLLAGCWGDPAHSPSPSADLETAPATEQTEQTAPVVPSPGQASDGVAPGQSDPAPTGTADIPVPGDQGSLCSTLAGESVLGLVLMEPTQEELELAGQVQEVFPPQQYGERMLIVPRLPGSSVIIQQLNYDSEGGLTGAQEIWRAQGQPEAVLLQQDIPEGYPTLRVVIQAGAYTGSYEVAYYGRGDGRRDFYVWMDREA